MEKKPERISKREYANLSDEEKEHYEPHFFFHNPDRAINFYILVEV